MIKCVNWILTRKCNLSCDYCKISKNYINSPYPSIDYFFKNEMSTDFIIKGLNKFKNYNPNCFHIFLGGEPLLRKDLPDIIDYCNKNNIFYTIISNNTDQIQNMVKKLFLSVKYVRGFTFSIDPMNKKDNDSYKKGHQGYKNIMKYIDHIEDPVAEITIDKFNIGNTIPLVEELSSNGIVSDITFIDIAKTKYYDFSNITDDNILVNKNNDLLDLFEKLKKLNVHMADILLPKIFDILPSNFNCNIQNNIHNITIDSDGSIRLCLRIRGIETPKNKLFDYLSNNDIIDDLINNVKLDKLRYCCGCNWTCPIMTMTNDHNEMIHISKGVNCG